MVELKTIQIEQTDPRLGRNVVHDPRSRRFPFPHTTSTPPRDITLRVYLPRPVPNQDIGCCTGCDAVVKLNTSGVRRRGERIRNLDDAKRIYTRATQLDPFPGSWPPDDTGSSGLAACQAQKEAGDITGYEWIFSGTDGIFAALAAGRPVGVGTWWKASMFHPDPASGLVDVTGPNAGGHQWTVIGWRRRLDAFVGQCLWGSWGLGRTSRFLIARRDLGSLLADDGDAHVVTR